MRYYCVLCGVHLAAHTGPLPAHGTRLDWRREIRAVRSERGRCSPSLTGLGFFDSTALRASNNANASYMDDSRHDMGRHYLYYSSSANSWTFPFHESCWQILLEQVSLLANFQEPKRVAELLFDFVYCLPYDRCYFPFPAHDFGGASQFLHLPEIPHGPWEFLQADPNALSLISSIATSHATADWFRETAEGVADRFSCLSLEVSYSIIIFLQSSDLCNLRLSSRTIASLTKPRDLPQSFWASRFRADMEMGFFPLEFESTGFFNLKVDWRRRYFNVKHALRDRTQTGHVRNRRRVWQSLGHLTQCLVPILFQNPIPQDGSCTELCSSEYKLGQLVQGLLRQNSSRYGGMGMRLFRTEHLLFSSLKSDAKSVHISVSSLNFNCTEYICGMRVFQDGIEVSCAGLFMPRSEIHISITPQDHLRSIRVASFVCGIVGIGFELEDATGYRSWKTAGILDNPPDGVGIATLEPRAGHEVCGAMIGFDACKFVSIQLLESQLDSIVPNGTSPSTAIPMPWLWHPIEPDSCANQMILGCPPEQQQAPLEPTFVLNMDFGGPGGSHLSRLNRVTALHDDYYGSFRGFHFFYTDGTKRMFGTRQIIDTMSKRWTCIEQSFALDGPGGERITSLYFGREDTAHGMFVQVIKMATSRGRVLEFQRRDRRSNASKSDKESNLTPPQGEIVTGMLATVQLSTGSLQSLGICCLHDVPDTNINHSPKPTHSGVLDPPSFPIDPIHLKKAPRVLQNSSSCFTSAILANIRRVGISSGISDRTRGANHVSGLRFEFWGSSIPIYIGQWFCEVDHLNLEESERITGFTFWQTQESHPNNTQRENHGRITGCQVEKSGLGQKTAEIYYGDKNDMLVYSFTENPYEELKGLVWGFSHDCDYIHVVTRPPEFNLEFTLVLHNILDFWPNSRIPGKLFWQIQGLEANWISISQIHAVFSEDRRLSGFVFEYGKGQLYNHVGHIEGAMASMSLNDSERVTRMDVSVGVSEDEVIFYTSTNRMCSLVAPSSNSESNDRSSSDFEIFMLEDPPGSETDHLPTSDGTLVDSSHLADGKNCVGIWVTMKIFPRAVNVVEAVGPIFAKKLE